MLYQTDSENPQRQQNRISFPTAYYSFMLQYCHWFQRYYTGIILKQGNKSCSHYSFMTIHFHSYLLKFHKQSDKPGVTAFTSVLHNYIRGMVNIMTITQRIPYTAKYFQCLFFIYSSHCQKPSRL